jgi:hypothetical protein
VETPPPSQGQKGGEASPPRCLTAHLSLGESEPTMRDKLTWKKVSRQTYTAPVGDGYYEIIEHRAGKWGCKLSHPDSSGERGAYA